jgi:predicted dienelactone hydrolase
VPFSGSRKMAVWYPSDDAQVAFSYSRAISTTLAFNGRTTTRCGRFPLIIFSHGLGGCGTQSIFFTETLARQGYIVAAPDHDDAYVCRVDGSAGEANAGGGTAHEPSVYNPQLWIATTYFERRADVELVIGEMTAGDWSQVTDPGEIGMAGHSLGGYTALAMAGGWASWYDARIKVALLFSPYAFPFAIQQTLSNVRVPLMYQGAELDLGITPYLVGPTGAYSLSNAPKYFVKLHGGSHITWTNATCSGESTVAGCLAAAANAELIDAYGIAFLNLYLKHQRSALLTSNGAGLSAYAYQQ